MYTWYRERGVEIDKTSFFPEGVAKGSELEVPFHPIQSAGLGLIECGLATSYTSLFFDRDYKLLQWGLYMYIYSIYIYVYIFYILFGCMFQRFSSPWITEMILSFLVCAHTHLDFYGYLFGIRTIQRWQLFIPWPHRRWPAPHLRPGAMSPISRCV